MPSKPSSEPQPPASSTTLASPKESLQPAGKSSPAQVGTTSDPPTEEAMEEKALYEGAEGLPRQQHSSLASTYSLCDVCLSLVCPCITYGQILEALDPKEKPSSSSCCSLSLVGCGVWTGIVAISALAIQVPLFMPSSLPSIALGGGLMISAAEPLMIFPYFIPHCLCHFPLRLKAFETMDDPENSEHCCMSCLEAVFCSCCSLAVLKAWASESGAKFDRHHHQPETGKWCPYIVNIEPAQHQEVHMEAMPILPNSMSKKDEHPPDTRMAPYYYHAHYHALHKYY